MAPNLPPGRPGQPPMDPVEEALKLAGKVVHEQNETIETLIRCLTKCCHCKDDDDDERGDRDRRRRDRDRDRDDDR